MQCLIEDVIYEDDSLDILYDEITTSKEAQICCECGDTIIPGVKFHRIEVMYELYWEDDKDYNEDTYGPTSIESFNTCSICHGLRRLFHDRGFGILYEDIDDELVCSLDEDVDKVEDSILMNINYTELQWLLRFDVLNLDNDLDDDED